MSSHTVPYLYLPDGTKLTILGDTESKFEFTVSLKGAKTSNSVGSIEIKRGSDDCFPNIDSDKIIFQPEGVGQFETSALSRLWLVLYWYFSHPSPSSGPKKGPHKSWTVNIATTGIFSNVENIEPVAAVGLVSFNSSSPIGPLECYAARSSFWQIPWEYIWRNFGSPRFPKPIEYKITNGIRHPLRPRPSQKGDLYRRWVPSLEQCISFRLVNRDTDTELVHRWMNDPRVAAFWGEDGGDVEKTRTFLSKGLGLEHCYPIIGCWDDEPFGYFEVYWTKEDSLGKFVTDCDGWDRGVHCLIGEQKFRGPHRVGVWISSLVHYMFLDDPRTQTVMLEPRVDNEKGSFRATTCLRFIKYLTEAGFYKEKEFAFPHKQSALMKLKREAWEKGPLL